MDELEQYYQDDFCIEADVLYDELQARIYNRVLQQQTRTPNVVRFPENVFVQTMEARPQQFFNL